MPQNEPRSEEYLVVRLGDEYYALAGSAVREVARWRSPTPVPGSPPLLPGIINQRGVVLPVVDLRRLLGIEAAPPDRATRLVIIHQSSVRVALMVDTALDLLILQADDLLPPPVGLSQQRARLLHAVSQYDAHPLQIFNMEALISTLQEAG
ncbi:CheW protein [Oscillochloris trichoides DG-6]|uniref:CheW protein n=1 Tax=Oscillochloris trichoides DG-6 TaxID=765420 RepID=E1IGH6_9CHLR|nr:chemotaxis protein CheW [Oscillochloris trichoides]EFO79742.1 CheW protein [Oscillochloris trichoides DG-6]